LHLGNGAVAVIGGVGDEQRCSYPGDGDVRGEPVAEFEIEEGVPVGLLAGGAAGVAGAAAVE